jgi:hypothetical protein
MQDGKAFGIGGLWENWKDLASGEWIRTFAVIATDANELVAEIHDRMPAYPGAKRLYALAQRRARPARLDIRPYPAEPIRMSISTRVTSSRTTIHRSLIQSQCLPHSPGRLPGCYAAPSGAMAAIGASLDCDRPVQGEAVAVTVRKPEGNAWRPGLFLSRSGSLAT